MEIYRCYELFLTDRKISGCSEATLRFYKYVIGKLLRFIEEKNDSPGFDSKRQTLFKNDWHDLPDLLHGGRDYFLLDKE
jgi:hypothetical protein